MYVLGSEHSIQKNMNNFADLVNANKAQTNGRLYAAEELAKLNRLQRAYGGLRGKAMASDMMKGDTILRLGDYDEIDGAKARTITSDGVKSVFMHDIAASGDTYNLLEDVVTLTHESRRDGYNNGSNQKNETRSAVNAHISAYEKMLSYYGPELAMNNDALFQDFMQYREGGNEYIDNAYSSEEDYWKLVEEDGQWKWQEDGNLDFDIQEMLLKDPSLRGVLDYFGVNAQLGVIAHEDMGENAIRTLASAAYQPNRYLDTSIQQGLAFETNASRNVQRYKDNFMRGTQSLSKASRMASLMMSDNQNLTNENLNSMFTSLYDVQMRDILSKNNADLYSGQVLQQSENEIFPIALGDNGKAAVTNLFGWSFITNRFHNDVKDKTLYPLHGYKRHEQVDLTNSDGALLNAFEGGTYSLAMAGGFGLQAIMGNTQGLSYEVSHLSSQSIMNYIAAFGTNGISMDQAGVLSGVPLGLQVGRMGNTGNGTGIHFDLALKQNNVKIDPLEFIESEYGIDLDSIFSVSNSVLQTTGLASNNHTENWYNIYNYSLQNPEKNNWEEFFWNNYSSMPSSFWNNLDGPTNSYLSELLIYSDVYGATFQ